jgi:hypothetical protein
MSLLWFLISQSVSQLVSRLVSQSMQEAFVDISRLSPMLVYVI